MPANYAKVGFWEGPVCGHSARFASLCRRSAGIGDTNIASLKAIYDRRQTFYEHQSRAKEYLGLKDVTQEISDQLAIYLRVHANKVVSVDELVTAVQPWLYEPQLIIPAGSCSTTVYGRAPYQSDRKYDTPKVAA